MASGLGEAFVSDALSALAGRWVVLVGDSSIRMVYHFLIQFLSGEWESWPGSVGSHYQAGSCFDVPKEAHEGGCSWDSPSCPCLEDAFVDQTRLTMVWTKYGHSADLLPLHRLANSSVGTPTASSSCPCLHGGDSRMPGNASAGMAATRSSMSVLCEAWWI